jgi:hypothetical protein
MEARLRQLCTVQVEVRELRIALTVPDFDGALAFP